MTGAALAKMKRVRSTRQTRASTRLALGRLREHLLANKTVAVYRSAVRFFTRWLARESIHWPEEPEDLDDLLQQYAEHCWQDGGTKADFGNLLSALSHPLTGIARIASYIKGSWKVYGLWTFLEKKQRCFPLSPLACNALAGAALKKGWYDMAFVVLMAFHCLLRTHEFCDMRSGDLVVAPNCLKAVLNLPFTKTSKRNRTEESVTVTDRYLVAFGHALQQDRLPGDKFLSISGQTFRERFRVLLQSLDLSELNVLPYSLRRGGATAHFRTFNSLHRTATRGRWSSLSTARIYVNEALGDLGQFSTDDLPQVRAAARQLVTFLTE
jgi:hypothetical protein